MCGIAGLIHTDAGAPLGELASHMARVLVHRGPDDTGIWIDHRAGAALAHRRLSIIDVSPLGHQPMLSPSGRYVVVYNGEIYNFEALRTELNSSGRAPEWKGHSDTEVLLAAVEAWGLPAALSRLVGMFAIALWDREAKVLSLARDRLGEKPIYYGWVGGFFCFASELKSIRALPGASLEIDRQALSQYMQFGYVSAPRCIYRGIRQLPPGTYAEIEGEKAGAEPRTFWKLAEDGALVAELSTADDNSLIDLTHDRIRAAVGLQMVSDVPLGAFLSGGIDSSTIVALMQSQTSRPVRSFTIGFDDRAYDEAPYARAVASHLGTEHTELYVTSKDAEQIIPELSSIYDEPFADSSQIPTILVSRLTRRHVTVSLSGDGGDELFCGYPRYDLAAALWRRLHLIPDWIRTLAAAGLQSPSERGWDRVLGMAPGRVRASVNGRRIHRLGRLLRSKRLADLYIRLVSQWHPDDRIVLGDFEPVDEALAWPVDGSAIRQMRRWDLGKYLPDDLLVKVDRASMSASLESRAPFLDHRVVELAFALPERMLVRDGHRKWVLRQVLERYVPRHLFERPKAGFGVPLAQWLRGPLKEWAAQLLDPVSVGSEGYLDAGKVSELWVQHQAGVFDRSAYLWNVLVFQSWLRGRDA